MHGHQSGRLFIDKSPNINSSARNGEITIDGSLLLANDTDVDDGDVPAIQWVGNASGAAVVLSGGDVLFEVDEGVSSATFQYQIIDAGGITRTATVSVDVVDNSLNVLVLQYASDDIPGSAGLLDQITDETFFNFNADVVSNAADSNAALDSGDYHAVLIAGDWLNVPNATKSDLIGIALSDQNPIGIVTVGQFAEGLSTGSPTSQAIADLVSPLDAGSSAPTVSAPTLDLSAWNSLTGDSLSVDTSGTTWVAPSSLDPNSGSSESPADALGVVDGTSDAVFAVKELPSLAHAVYLGGQYHEDNAAYRTGTMDELLEKSIAYSVGITEFSDVITADGIIISGKGADELTGGTGSDTIFGGEGDDVITGQAGDDTLQGDGGDDLFVFNNGDGNDTLVDFTVGAGSDDVLDVSAFDLGAGGLDSLLALDAAGKVNQVGVDTVIQIDGDDSITLVGVAKSTLHEDDFLFS